MRQTFERGLQFCVERQPVDALLRRAPERGFAGMRGEHRKCPAFLRHGFALGGIMFGPSDHTACKHPVEDSVAGSPRGNWITIRPPGFRRLRQGDQQCRLGDREPLRLAAEIGKARRPEALDIAAIRCEREVKIEDAGLIVRRSIFTARSICANFAAMDFPAWGSMSRATCIVSVEPPETIWPWLIHCSAARPRLRKSTP